MRLLLAAAALVLAATLATGKEGDACFHRKLKQAGTCRQLSSCAAVVAADQRQQCAFRRGDSVPTVCCPTPAAPDVVLLAISGPAEPTALPCVKVLQDADRRDGPVAAGTAREPGAVAKEMCRRYARFTCAKKRVTFPFDEITVVDYCESQNRTDQLIVGGREARPKEYPHMVMLGFGERDNIQYLCGGTIIAQRFVLTAAHCLFSGSDPVRWVVLGALLRSEKEHKGARPQLVAVSERIKHPEYKPPSKYHDIALLRLAKDAIFDEGFARPACLSTEPAVETKYKKATATGWGLTEWDGEQSSVLMTVNLDMTPLSDCQKAYGNNAHGISKGILNSQVCAGSPGKDSCEGDSGGPLQLFPSDPYCMFHVVGVVSFGQFCGFTTPGVYTRVAHYLSWIEGIVWPQPPFVTQA